MGFINQLITGGHHPVRSYDGFAPIRTISAEASKKTLQLQEPALLPWKGGRNCAGHWKSCALLANLGCLCLGYAIPPVLAYKIYQDTKFLGQLYKDIEKIERQNMNKPKHVRSNVKQPVENAGYRPTVPARLPPAVPCKPVWNQLKWIEMMGYMVKCPPFNSQMMGYVL